MEPAFATPSANAATTHGAESGKFHTYVSIAMILAVITSIEIVLIFLPFPRWLILTALVVLSAVKFLFVIFVFMHLRWDKIFCTILFFIGLILAGGTVWALLQLFSTKEGKPLTATAALAVPPPHVVVV